MKSSSRKEKLLALQAAVTGNVGALLEFQRQQAEKIVFMVVCDNETPRPTDLVDVRLPNKNGQKRITYADFLKNPVSYGNFCVTVNNYEPSDSN